MVTKKTYIGLALLSIIVLCKSANITDSINQFALQLLATTNSEAGDNLNIALSPYTVWTLLTIISEGAQGNSLKQLKETLKLDDDVKKVRNEFLQLSNNLQKDSDGVQLQISNGIFTNGQFKLKDAFARNSKEFYNVETKPIDFSNTKYAVNEINNYIARNTNNRIHTLVTQDDIRNAYIFLTSVLLFKGQWKTPFNRTATKPEAFYDEKHNRLGDVQMMYQTGYYPFSRMEEFKAYAVELPYGHDNKMSMYVVLPFKNTHISTTLNLLAKSSFQRVIKILEDAEAQFSGEEIKVYLPKFKIQSEFILDRVLNKMGIKDIFNSQSADLLGILDQYLYVTKLLQRAEIEVDEEGTVAAAASGASFAYKSPPPKFQANRPFLYFIVDKSTKTVIFTGKVGNPNTLHF